MADGNGKSNGGFTLEQVLVEVTEFCRKKEIVPPCKGDVLRIAGKAEDALYYQKEVERFSNVYMREVRDEAFKRVRDHYRRFAYD